MFGQVCTTKTTRKQHFDCFLNGVWLNQGYANLFTLKYIDSWNQVTDIYRIYQVVQLLYFPSSCVMRPSCILRSYTERESLHRWFLFY